MTLKASYDNRIQETKDAIADYPLTYPITLGGIVLIALALVSVVLVKRWTCSKR